MCAHIKGKACSAVIMAALVCSAAISMVSAPLRGDLNGDNACNVSDLQHLVSQILTNGLSPAAAPSDLNSDGKVDILDLQTILAETQQGPPRPASSPKDPQPNAIFSEYNDKVLFKLEPRTTGGWSSEETLPARLLCLYDQEWTNHLQVVERYTFSLNPHAPPRCA